MFEDEVIKIDVSDEKFKELLKEQIDYSVTSSSH